MCGCGPGSQHDLLEARLQGMLPHYPCWRLQLLQADVCGLSFSMNLCKMGDSEAGDGRCWGPGAVAIRREVFVPVRGAWICSLLPAVEKKHLLMSLLCISSVLTVGPGCWGKQSYSWVAPQPLSTGPAGVHWGLHTSESTPESVGLCPWRLLTPYVSTAR